MAIRTQGPSGTTAHTGRWAGRRAKSWLGVVSALVVALTGQVVAETSAHAAEIHFFVATDGQDSNPGTAQAPFQTLERAQQAVRSALGDASGPITVWVRGGTHYLTDPLVFGPDDSGTAQAPVTYAAAPGERAVVSGGQPLTPSWSAYEDGIMVADVPAGLAFDQLFVNGERQVLARYPNFQAGEILDGHAADAISPARVATWAHPETGLVRAIHSNRWGGNSFTISGVADDGEPILEWVGDNNRGSGMHASQRMVENIFEELDAPGEWFYDDDAGRLYFYPPAGLDLASATVEVPLLDELAHIEGTAEQLASHITFSGLTFTHTLRTLFSRPYEPLLLGDWSVARAGAIFATRAEQVTVENSVFDQLGGNGVFFSGDNSGHLVMGNHFRRSGASDVLTIGLRDAVRDPSTWEDMRRTIEDTTPGPKTEDYPRDIVIDGNHLESMGRFEKQTAGVQISMSHRITVRGNTIHGSPRACVNINDGTWGGHLIEGNEIFDCVLETNEHGPINAWGRDRYWPLTADDATKKQYALLDAMDTTVIRRNRIWHGESTGAGRYSVDLDDGSTNYEISENVFLNSGVKLREGFHRTVRGNVFLNGGTHNHVSFAANEDRIESNIFATKTPYFFIRSNPVVSQTVFDHNLFWNDGDPVDGVDDGWRADGFDTHSMIADPQFAAGSPWDEPGMLDYTVSPGSPALGLGFRNFPMDQFGIPGGPTPAAVRWPLGEAYAAMGFGVFLHYGLATFVGQTPWNYDPDDVAASVYDPPDFDPDQWMDAIAASGAKYVILTTKHHDGFVMWPSEYTDYGVRTSSDPETDVVGEVVRAARERGLEVVLYYSWYDKLHPGGNVQAGPPTEEYVEYAQNHLRELLTNYGPVAGIWLDTPLHARETGISEFIHSVSPETAFIWKYIAGGQQLPAYPDADLRTYEGLGQRDQRVNQLGTCDLGGPAEVAYNVSAGLGWWQMSDAPPSVGPDRVLSELTYTNALGGTLSLNVSPGPSGRIPPASVELLEAAGDVLRGDNLLAGAPATASAETDADPAAHATDSFTETAWRPGDEEAWLRVDLSVPVMVDRAVVQFTAADAVTGYEVQYLDADGVWRTASAGVASAATQSDEFRGVTTSSVRLVLDGVVDGAGVVELKAFGGLDDTGAAVSYDGGWQALARPAGLPEVPRLPPSVPFAGAFNESIHRSRTVGDTAEFGFTGSGVQLHASTGPDQGSALVSVDGGMPELVDLYRPEPGRDVVVFQRRGLSPGEHSITVEVTGERHDDSAGSWVSVDRATPLASVAAAAEEPFEVLPDGRLIYDDGDRCAGESPIEYGGAWESGGWAGAHNGTRHYSNVAGASAEMSFTGTAVAVMAQTRPGHGIAAISVDGGEPELVDTYSNPAQEQVVVWERTGLEPGEHTVRIEVTGDSNPAATNTWVALDAIIVTP